MHLFLEGRVKTATYRRDTLPEPQKTLRTNNPKEQCYHPSTTRPERKTRPEWQR